VQAVATASDPAFVGGGLYAALRPEHRTRLALTAAAGALGGGAAFRGELLGHFLVNPDAAHGPGVYLGGGVAVVAGPVERGYAVVTVGIEGRPRGRSGWAVEAGVGGGVRVTVGWRRRFGSGR
jgi:hypothetical protein